MQPYVHATIDLTLVLLAGAVFVILYTVIYKALSETVFDQKVSTILVSGAVSVLCILGMRRVFWPVGHPDAPPASGTGPAFDFLLLPYAALGLVIIILSLLMTLCRRVCRNRPKKRSKRDLPMAPPSTRKHRKTSSVWTSPSEDLDRKLNVDRTRHDDRQQR